MGCDNDCVLPSCLLAFSAGISVYAYFWFYAGRLETLEKGSGRGTSVQRFFSQSSSPTLVRRGLVELGRAETVETED